MKVTVKNIIDMKNTMMWWAIVEADEHAKKMWKRLFYDTESRACMKYCKTTQSTLRVICKINWLAAWLSAQDNK